MIAASDECELAADCIFHHIDSLLHFLLQEGDLDDIIHFCVQRKALRDFMADGHFLTGLAHSSLLKWRQSVALAAVERLVELKSINIVKRKILSRWRELLQSKRHKETEMLKVAHPVRNFVSPHEH